MRLLTFLNLTNALMFEVALIPAPKIFKLSAPQLIWPTLIPKLYPNTKMAFWYTLLALVAAPLNPHTGAGCFALKDAEMSTPWTNPSKYA